MMVRRSATVLALLVALSAGVAAGTASGALYLSTLPTGANVWIDGTYVGTSPVLVDPLRRGRHTVTLTKTGWLMQEEDVEVSGGSTSMVSYRLQADRRKTSSSRTMGSAALRGLTSDARVAIDGERVADASLPIALGMGTHVATLTTPAGKTSRTFTVYPDTTTQVLFTSVLTAEHPSLIVAPAEEFLPDGTYSIVGKKIVVHYGGHDITATLGDSAVRFDGTMLSYDAVPSRIKGKLYLPLALLTRLTATKEK